MTAANRTNPPQLVLWDVDGTLVKGGMESLFIRWLRMNHYTSYCGILRNAAAITLEHRRYNWHRIKLAYLRGRAVEIVRSRAQQCWETEIVPALFARPIEAVRMLNKQRGVRQVLLTGGPRPLVELLAGFLEVEDIIAAEPVIVDGKYTGGYTAPHPIRERKVAAAERWMKHHEYDWSRTVAVADHYDDRFLFERVALPVVMNPGRRMARLANERGWPIFGPKDDPASVIAVIMGEQRRQR